MRFETGDLVRIKEDTAMYDMLESCSNIGIVVSSGVLMLVHIYEDKERKEFWAYDVVIDGRRYKNIPEEILEEISKDEDKIDLDLCSYTIKKRSSK